MTFELALRSAGLLPREVVADGTRRRCPTADKPKHKNGQYVLLLDGVTGFWRNFAEGMDWNVWKDGSATAPRPVDPAVLEAQRERERAERRAGLMAVRELWAAGSDYRPHPYLTGKGLSAAGCHQLRTWQGRVWVDKGEFIDDTWLLAPLYWRDRLVNVQRISATGVKRQMKNASQRACSLILGRAHWSVTVLVEGLATGLAVFQSVRHARVIVCFFADNLLPVVEELKPTGSVVICADNDHGTMAKRGFNPGIEKAQNAASLIDCGVWWPKGIEGTDAADWLREIGGNAGKQLERQVIAAARYVLPTAAAP